VVFERGSGFEIAAGGLNFAELIERFVKLPGEAGAVESEVSEWLNSWQGIGVLLATSGLGEDVSFEQRDAAEAPGGVGEFLDKMSFSCVGWLVFVAELAAVLIEGGAIFGGQDGGAGGQSVTECVTRRTLLAGIGARAGGMFGVGAIDGRALNVGVIKFGCSYG
jgi:hypothetical protein